jgi:sugar phosphate isomerase/epimerase
MELGGHIIGVCSWSLQPKSMSDLVAKLKQAGLSHIQLALSPLLKMEDAQRDAEIAVLKSAGVQLLSGMVGFTGEDYSKISVIKQTGGYVPDAQWLDRRDLTERAARLCKELGLKVLTTHVGFVPASSDQGYARMVERVNDVAKICADQGVRFLMETGQEGATELLQFLNDLPSQNVGINFDPANMILYGAGDPIEAIGVLERHIGQVHIKDAKHSDNPGSEWGEEVAFGSGEVPVAEFIGVLHSNGYKGAFVIEREAGADRVGDVRYAIESLRQAL